MVTAAAAGRPSIINCHGMLPNFSGAKRCLTCYLSLQPAVKYFSAAAARQPPGEHNAFPSLTRPTQRLTCRSRNFMGQKRLKVLACLADTSPSSMNQISITIIHNQCCSFSNEHPSLERSTGASSNIKPYVLACLSWMDRGCLCLRVYVHVHVCVCVTMSDLLCFGFGHVKSFKKKNKFCHFGRDAGIAASWLW